MKYCVKILRTFVCQLEIEADNPSEALIVARERANLLTDDGFEDPGLEDDIRIYTYKDGAPFEEVLGF